MPRLEKSPSRQVLAPFEEVTALVRASQPQSAGCTCGAARQLDEERNKLGAQCRSSTERAGALHLREAELEERAQALEVATEEIAENERQLGERWSQAQAELAELEATQLELDRREAHMKRDEDEMRSLSASLEALEGDAGRREEALADEESALMDERNAVEDELSKLLQDKTEHRYLIKAHEDELEDLKLRIDEVEAERDMFSSDDQLLTDIQEQVEPLCSTLSQREGKLSADETDLCSREADCDQREATLVVEYRRSIDQLQVAEERTAELKQREAVSEQQLLRLIERQREQGAGELRLSSLEGALVRQRDTAPQPLNRGPTVAAEKDMRAKLAKLRRGDAEWAGRIQAQQAEVRRLQSILTAAGHDKNLPAPARQQPAKVGATSRQPSQGRGGYPRGNVPSHPVGNAGGSSGGYRNR